MFTGFLVSAQEKSEIQVLEAAEFNRVISKDPNQFIDIRTPEEFEAGHIKGAENIDFLAEGFLSKIENLDRDQPLIIYCRTGNRSAKAASKLSELGFKKIIDLKGGYKAWEDFEKKE